MSLSGNLNYSNGNNDRDVFNNYLTRLAGRDSTRIQNQLIANSNNNYSLWSNITYMEPLWAKNFIEFNYIIMIHFLHYLYFIFDGLLFHNFK